MAASSPAWVWVLAVVVALCTAVPAASQPQPQAPPLGAMGSALVVEDEVHHEVVSEHEVAPHTGHGEAAEHGGHAPAKTHHGSGAGPADAHGGGGAHGGGQDGGHEGQHHIEKTPEGTTTAVMLMGFVAFVMALFYLVNWHDEDIRRYTWVVISVTVSIFVAVLFFSAITEGLTFFLQESIIVDFTYFLLLWILTQFFLFLFREVEEAKDVGALAPVTESKDSEMQPLGASAADRDSSEVESSDHHHDQLRSVETSETITQIGTIAGSEIKQHGTPNVPLKAFGTLFAHITGFAAIRCFLTMQLSPYLFFSSSSWASLLILPLFGLVAYLLVVVSGMVRKRLILDTGDGKEDEWELLWREQCRDTEDDAVGLCMSMLVSVVIRYSITGVLPSAHGNVEGRCAVEVCKLFVVGVLLAVILVAVTFLINKREAKGNLENTSSLDLVTYCDFKRFYDLTQVTVGLTMSWCFFFGTQWSFLVHLQGSESLRGGVAGKLLQAMILSFACTLVIFLLDFVGDGFEHCKKALTGVITSLGLLVGLSWEGTFALGVEEIAVNWETPGHQLIVKSCLALGLVAIVLPAWRLYILPHSDDEIMAYYRGRQPPLSALWRTWDPVKDFKPSKSAKNRQERQKVRDDAAMAQYAR